MGRSGKGASSGRLHPCNDEQRRQSAPGQCHRARSGLTRPVSKFVSEKFSVHQGFQRLGAVNCRFEVHRLWMSSIIWRVRKAPTPQW